MKNKIEILRMLFLQIDKHKQKIEILKRFQKDNNNVNLEDAREIEIHEIQNTFLESLLIEIVN